MTKAELVAALERYPDDAVVYIHGNVEQDGDVEVTVVSWEALVNRPSEEFRPGIESLSGVVLL